MTDSQIQALRNRGLDIPDGWRITRFAKNPEGDWSIELAGPANGEQKTAGGHGWEIGEAMDALRWTLPQALMSEAELAAVEAQRKAQMALMAQRLEETEAERVEATKRRQLCDPCQESQHDFCTGCPCSELYPSTASRHL